MKKHNLIRFIALLLLTLSVLGCGKDESETIVIPDTLVEESDVPVEEPIIEEPIVKEQVSEEPITEEPVVEEQVSEEPEYPYWWDLHDYNLDQPVLAPDGEFKNLTLQPGIKPDELFVTWFSKSSSRG